MTWTAIQRTTVRIVKQTQNETIQPENNDLAIQYSVRLISPCHFFQNTSVSGVMKPSTCTHEESTGQRVYVYKVLKYAENTNGQKG